MTDASPLTFTPTGPPVVTGTPTTTVPTGPRPTLLAESFGVRADGRTDCTLALQAAINAAVAERGGIVQLPPGVMLISSPLVIQDTTGQILGGIILQGAGPGPQSLTTQGGSCIQMTRPGQDSVLKVGAGRFYGSEFRQFSLVGFGDTKKALHWADTQWTQCRADRITASGVNTAFQVDYNSGAADGEDLILQDCRGVYVNCFFRNNAGQAYACHIRDGEASFAAGGATCIEIGSDAGGFKGDCLGLSCTFSFRDPRNTFLSVPSFMTGQYTVRDVRCESVSTVVSYAGGSPSMDGQITITDSHFTNLDGTAPLLSGGGTNAQWRINMLRNRFDAPAGSIAWQQAAGSPLIETLSVQTNGGDRSRRLFRECSFFGFGAVNLGPAPAAPSTFAGTVIEDCWMDTQGSRTLSPVTN